MDSDTSAIKNFETERSLDFSHYLFVLAKYKWKILFSAFSVTALVAIVLLFTPPVYKSQAVLLIESAQSKSISIDDLYGLDLSLDEYLQTQFEILRSRAIAQKVIERLQLDRHPEFTEPSMVERGKVYLQRLLSEKMENSYSQTAISDSDSLVERSLEYLNESLYADPTVTPSKFRSKLMEEFQSRLEVKPIPNTQLVTIVFSALDPDFAAQVANTVGEVYVENHMDAKLDMAKKASDWLTTRMEELLVSLRRSEERLQAYKEREGLIDIDGNIGIASLEINDIAEQLTLQKQKRDEMRSLYELVQKASRSNSTSLEGIAEISSHNLVREVKIAEVEAVRNVAELSKRYGPKHSKMIAAKSQLAEVRANMRSQVRKLLNGIEQAYEAAEANVVALQRELDLAQVRYQKESRREAEYLEYQREVESNRRIYETFLNRMKETGAMADFDSAHARFTDVAVPPLNPDKPKKKLLVVTSFALMLILATTASFTHYALTNTVGRSSEVEGKLAQRLVGSVPYVSSNIDNHKGKSFTLENNEFAEAWRTIRTAYTLTATSDKNKVCCVTSTVPGEGKSTCATNLALSMSQLENTLLIEADLRRPVMSKRFGLPLYQPGIANLVTKTHPQVDCIQQVKGTNLKVMVAGSHIDNPLELLSSDSFRETIERLRGDFERIIIDTPPVDVVSDAMVLSQYSDSTLFIVRAGKVRIETIKRSLARLFSVKAKIDGIVLNAVTATDLADKSYYHYYGSNKKA